MKNGMHPDEKPVCRPEAEQPEKTVDEQVDCLVARVMDAMKKPQLPDVMQKDAHRIPTVGFVDVDYSGQK